MLLGLKRSDSQTAASIFGHSVKYTRFVYYEYYITSTYELNWIHIIYIACQKSFRKWTRFEHLDKSSVKTLHQSAYNSCLCRLKEAQLSVRRITGEKKVETRKINPNSLVRHDSLLLSPDSFSSVHKNTPVNTSFSLNRKSGCGRRKPTCRHHPNLCGTDWTFLVKTKATSLW